jgi:iron complex transport system substrate-binding protein
VSAPTRIVCLTEETTETLYLLGAADRIVGISAFTVRPPEAKRDKPVVSQYVKADIEKIVALKPDLVLGFSDLQAGICADLIRRGIEVYCFNQRSIAEILTMIRTLGRLVDRAGEGDALADRLAANLDRAREQAAALPFRPRVYFEEWPDPMISGIRWVSEIVDAAGGVEVFAELSEQPMAKNRVVTPQDVLDRRPDLYLASWCGRKFREDTARARPGFADAPFTHPGRMIEIPSAIILQPGPACLTDGLVAVQGAIRSLTAATPD